jgi:hypothetical protein
VAYKYIIDKPSNCIFVEHTGRFTFEEASVFYVELMQDSGFKPNMNILRDLRAAKFPEDTDYQTVSLQARKVFDVFDRDLERAKIALVAADGHDYKILHQWILAGRLASGDVERRVFRSMEEAKSWLGLAEDHPTTFQDFAAMV